MTKLFIFSILLLSTLGCGATKGVNATLFLKETDTRFYDLKGNSCLVSGYDIKPNLGTDTFRLVTYFANCDVREERTLKEFELKIWGVKPKSNIGIQ